jgi:hypothetical protein
MLWSKSENGNFPVLQHHIIKLYEEWVIFHAFLILAVAGVSGLIYTVAT